MNPVCPVPPDCFDPACTRCPRLVDFLTRVRARHPGYHAAPVPPFGDPEARLLIVGLAPGMHGANASGRPFTGDFAGILLYQTLFEMGFASAPESSSRDDGLKLRDCRITNAVKCLPPENKPLTPEVRACNDYLARELALLAPGSVVLALGTVAHNAVLRALGLRQSAHRFGHGHEHALGNGLMLVDSYHCSRYNTQTGRLTSEMFKVVFAQVKRHLDGS
ncbi:uracil-DNA glycosylase [Ectothiorhodospira shaposhnikovii]|uniref:uracil-DNA glycosylase n=1 Tax=Ectothiorhodospira shaposhnikovii TaxID=1054 RepID=UPI001EE90518|nr:uracil-DNA glycosylase [Ectothiorhodospira shaposhnikovii]MCG5512624.1 uracil-DNA glycosylase [Ectothiorhodospira shaposhnikovii]